MDVDVVLRHVSMHDAVCVHEGGNDFRQLKLQENHLTRCFVIGWFIYRYVSFIVVIWCGSCMEWWRTFICVVSMGDKDNMV